MISAALAYVGLYFITRYLETDIYGTVTAAMALVATFNAVADLGFSSAHVMVTPTSLPSSPPVMISRAFSTRLLNLL